MRVTIIANGFQEDYTVNLINALADEEGLKVDFIGSDIYLNYPINRRIHYHNLRGSHDEKAWRIEKVKRIFRYYLKLLHFIRHTDSKVYHIQWLRFYFIDGILLPTLLKLMGKIVIYTVHDVLPHSQETPKMRRFFKHIYRKMDHLVVHTGYIKLRLQNEFKIPENKISVVRHGVYSLQLSEDLTKESCRKAMELKEKDIVLLFFGYITQYKGLPLLIEAFNTLKPKHSNLKLLVAGKVSKDYQDSFEQIKAGISSNDIQITTKYLEDTEVEQHYKAADIVVLPYLEASQSGVMFISYAYGKPVIAPNFGGFPYDIELGKTGLLFEKQNTTDLAAQIEKAIVLFCPPAPSPHEYITHFAKENYSWRNSAMALHKIYQSYLAKNQQQLNV